MDNADSVKKDSDHGAMTSGTDNPGGDEPDIPGRTSISSDDSTCSSLPLSEEFYYFYQGEIFFKYLNVTERHQK